MPVFLPKNGWEINNYQSDFLTLLPNATIKAGTKTLTFLQVVPKKKLTRSSEKKQTSKSSASASQEDDSIKKNLVEKKGANDEAKEPKPVDSANSTAPLDPIADAQN